MARYAPLPPVLRLAGALQEAWDRGKPFVVNQAEGSVTRIDWTRFARAVLPAIRTCLVQQIVAGELSRLSGDDRAYVLDWLESTLKENPDAH